MDIRSGHKEYLKEIAKAKVYKHKVVFNPIEPVTAEIPIDSDLILIPKPRDDNRNRLHDRSKPVEIKVEKPDCSSAEEDESTSAKSLKMPMGLVKPCK